MNVPGAFIVTDYQEIYNLVLEHTHVILVNGCIEAVTLGPHNIAELYHPLYGTERIIEVLQDHEGFHQGMVILTGR